MKLQRDIFIVALVCHLQATTDAEKLADNETPETYDKNLIQVVDDSVISGSACCGKLNLTADPHHGLWMIHFNKLGSYTITNTMVRNRNTWINDQDPEFIISWCGQFWHIGHRGEAGQCNGYVSTPDNSLCFQSAVNFRYYVHCINEWVDAAPSRLTISCLEDGRGQEGPRVAEQEGSDRRGEDEWNIKLGTEDSQERKEKLKQQQQLDIDPRALFIGYG